VAMPNAALLSVWIGVGGWDDQVLQARVVCRGQMFFPLQHKEKELFSHDLVQHIDWAIVGRRGQAVGIWRHGRIRWHAA